MNKTILNMRIFSVFVLSVVCFACTSAEIKLDEASYAEQKDNLSQKEKKHPLQFLSVSGDDKKNLLGQTVVRGTIHNKATVAAYKDVRIKMLCYKDAVMVEEHEDVIDKTIKPNTDIAFKTKYRLPRGTDSISISVMSAAVAEME